MKNLSYLIVLALILGLVFAGCSSLSNISQVPATEQSGISYLTKHTADEPLEVTLWAGQYINAGTVSVWNEEGAPYTLHVSFDTTGGWQLLETHLYVGKNVPPTNAPGQFPYKHESLGGVTSDSYIITLAEIDSYSLKDPGKVLVADGDPGVDCSDTIFIAAHCELQLVDGNGEDVEETGWGEGEEIDGGWAMYFTYEIQCEEPEEEEEPEIMCARTIGYWKNHLEDWCPLPSESIFYGVDALTLLTYFPGAGAEKNGVNPLEMLRVQLLAAELNVACFDDEFDYSLYDAVDIYDTIDAAEEFLKRLPGDLDTYWASRNKKQQSALKIVAEPLKDALDAFNNMGDECF